MASVWVTDIDPRFEDCPVHERLGLEPKTLFDGWGAKQTSWQAPLPGGLWLYKPAWERGIITKDKRPNTITIPEEWVEWSIWLDGNTIVKQAKRLRDTEVLKPPSGELEL